MTKKSRGRGSRGGYQHSARRGQAGRPNANVIANANAYAQLSSRLDENGDGEMNAHLVERFAGSYIREESSPRPEQRQVAPNASLREYFGCLKQPVVGGSWLEKPELPTTSEISSYPSSSGQEKIIDVAEEIQPNKVEGAYHSVDDYLGTQYSLLREDAIRPLREAVKQVREQPYLDEAEYADHSIGLYNPVYITSIVFSNRGLATRVAFSLSRVKKRVRWDQSKRLITGTLVALLPDDGELQTKCLIATVAARPLSALDQNPPEIDLFFARPEDMEIDPMRKWVMIECRSSFYEASRHTMLALQHMMREPFPLSEHLVNAQTHVGPPKYVQKNPYTDMSSLVAMEDAESFRNVNILEEWPNPASHGLDKSQSQALKRILTSQLAIIQGPPGTGKTYVSVVALKILLSNMTKDDPPIIVTCQTNHALDQLLRHVSEFEENFIRLGGRSKDKDKIKKRTLYEVRSSSSQQKPSALKSQALGEMRKLIAAMQTQLAPLEINKPLLSEKLLADLGIISLEQADSLDMGPVCAMGISANTPGIQMEQWLGGSVAPCTRPVLPDDFGMEFEEEDFEVEQLKELEAEAVAQDDDEFEALKGPSTLLCDNHTGRGTLRSDAEVREILRNNRDLNTVPVRDRGALYRYFQHQVKQTVVKEFRTLAKRYQELVLQRKIGQWEGDYKILRDQRVIGMTTTGLSKYRALIAAVKPKIVFVEEAAETLEAPVTAACLPSLEHLILVGDHQQLRPRCQVREFEDDPYNFNLSLFERMVINKLEIDVLTRQRRMIPEIRRLLEPIYGNKLKDHPTVTDPSNRPPVEGMGGCNSFFFTHEWPESRDGNMSALNEKEADMIVGFCDYLVLNGVDPSKITVLTFYNGQRKLITKKLRLHQNLGVIRTLNVITVDSYQGEENDIILLSLVRSNPRRQIGFLSVDNRVCVGLSRAKRGFYLFGNAENLAIESGTWGEVVEIMYGKRSSHKADKLRQLGYNLPLRCARHGRKVWIQDPEDWELINGGCDQKCRCTLPCGHICMLKCHPFENDLINCTQKCTKLVESCGHPCTAICMDPCRCLTCDRRGNGTKALLKSSAPKRPAQPASFPVDSPHQLSSEFSYPEQSLSQWSDYSNGGARADDANYLRMAEEEKTRFLESRSASQSAYTPAESTMDLIELSPTAPTARKQTNMLIDLGFGNDFQQLPSKGTQSYAAVAGKNKENDGRAAKPTMNLLD